MDLSDIEVPRVFVTCRNLDGGPIRGKDVELLIESDVFKKLDDNDSVSLCCVGIVQLVLLGVEDRRVNVFMWRLSLDRLPHRLNLSSRGMDIPTISCPSCNANVESANHVFFECDIATDMWKLVFRWCDIPLFQASSWDSFNDWIISWHASKEKKTQWVRHFSISTYSRAALVYMPINAGGVHWVTGAINLADSIFYVFNSMESEMRMLMLEQQVKDWTPVINSILEMRGYFNGTGRQLICTDIAKITRKRLKPDKHGHRNGRARKKPGESYQAKAHSVHQGRIDHQGHMQFGFDSLSNASVDRCFQRTILRIMSRLMDVVLRDYAKSGQGTLPSQTVTNPREHVNAITTRSGKTCEGPSTPLVPTSVVSTPLKEPEQNPETSMDKVQKPSSESTAQVPPPEDHDSIFIEIPKPKAKKTVQEPNSPEPDSYQPKLPYPERMKVREKDKPSAQQSRFMKLFKQLRLEIGLRDALIEMPKFNKWLSTLLRNKEKLEEIAITTVNAECSAIILNKVPEKLEDPGKFLIPCALQELDRTNALADSGASINLLPHSIYKQLGLGALKPTRMTLELANRSVTHPMGIAEDVVVRVDGFTFLADFVVVNFEPDPRVPIILGRPFLRTAKALIDLYEEKLTLRVGNDELVFYADKSEKSKNKKFAHAISVIDFSKDEPFSGSTTNHSDALPPSSSPVKTSDNLEEFADELTLLDSFPPDNDDSILKKDVHFQVYSNPLFEFDDNFNSSNVNPLFNEMVEDVKNKNSNVSNSDKPVLLNTPLTDKVEYDIDEIDAFLAVEVSSNLRMDVILFSMSSPQVKLFNTSFTRFAREHCKEYLSHFDFALLRFQLPCHQENLPHLLFNVEDSDPVQKRSIVALFRSPNLDHQDNPSAPRPPPEPPDVKIRFEPDTAVINNFDVLNKDACFNSEEGIGILHKSQGKTFKTKQTRTWERKEHEKDVRKYHGQKINHQGHMQFGLDSLSNASVDRTLDGSVCPFPSWNDVTWVYMPINAGEVHWVTGAVNLADSIF
ncbi:reverse transcriptase domain-containing protein [Tanacetum coccineum]